MTTVNGTFKRTMSVNLNDTVSIEFVNEKVVDGLWVKNNILFYVVPL